MDGRCPRLFRSCEVQKKAVPYFRSKSTLGSSGKDFGIDTTPQTERAGCFSSKNLNQMSQSGSLNRGSHCYSAFRLWWWRSLQVCFPREWSRTATRHIPSVALYLGKRPVCPMNFAVADAWYLIKSDNPLIKARAERTVRTFLQNGRRRHRKARCGVPIAVFLPVLDHQI